MNYTQKNAWYGLYLAGFLLLVPLIDLAETLIPFYALQALGLAGIVLLILPLYRINKSKDRTFDEFDRKVCLRAGIAAAILVCTVATIVYTTVLFAFESFTFTMSHLAVAIYSAAILFIASLSAAVLFQYHLVNKAERRQS